MHLIFEKKKKNWVYCLDAVGQTEEMLSFSSLKSWSLQPGEQPVS